jgi:UDP-N-acetyl-D-glucosamine dehydrogenase
VARNRRAQPRERAYRATRSWIVNAARIATPHNSARTMSFRVLMVAPQPSGLDRLIYHEPMPEAPMSDVAQPTKLVVVGQGYVGLPLAIRAVEQGFDVVGFDVDDAKVKRLEAGESTVEDVGDDRLQAALATGRYLPTTTVDDCADFSVTVISVPTPLRDGNPDLRFIEDAARAIGVHLRVGATVVLESTTYPGTTEELVAPILEERSGLVAGRDFHLGYSPERIDPGNSQWRLENTPKVVSGIDGASLAAVKGFYDQIVETTVPVSTPKEAELTKLLENTFRHVNIALVNELAMFANDLGIDVWEAIDAASTKPFGYMRFTPGPGVGGHCLPIDPSYLSWRVRRSLGQAFRFVELANDVNDHMPDYIVRRLLVTLNRRGLAVNGRRILLLGLSYKRNTGDARESPSQPIARQLLQLGAEVVAADPYVDASRLPAGVVHVELDETVLRNADAVVFLVDHDAFDPALVARHAQYVLDTRHCLPPADNVEYL